MKSNIFLLLFLPVVCFAGDTSKPNPYQALNVEIDRLMMASNYKNKLFIKVKGDITATENPCALNSKWNYVLNIDSEYDKSMQSMLMLAYASKRSVSLYAEIGENSCYSNNALNLLKRIELN